MNDGEREEAGCGARSFLFRGYTREADFLSKVQRKWCVLFSCSAPPFTWENPPSFEASVFKLIRKTINDGSFHEIVAGGISVTGSWIHLQAFYLWRREVPLGRLFSWRVNVNKCFTYCTVQGTNVTLDSYSLNTSSAASSACHLKKMDAS